MTKDVPVSVVIPVRNGAALIGEALRSVADQTWRPREIIVIDGDSGDDSEAVVRDFKNVIFLREPKAGPGEARNIGVRHARMPFLAFLDADDLWPETRTEQLLGRLLEESGTDIVTGKMQQFYSGPSGAILPLAAPVATFLPSVAVLRRAIGGWAKRSNGGRGHSMPACTMTAFLRPFFSVASTTAISERPLRHR